LRSHFSRLSGLCRRQIWTVATTTCQEEIRVTHHAVRALFRYMRIDRRRFRYEPHVGGEATFFHRGSAFRVPSLGDVAFSAARKGDGAWWGVG